MTPEQRAQFSQAVFRCEPLSADWPADFAIITAYDPDGQPTTAEQNLAADAALEADLRAAGYRLHRITGGSADGVHLVAVLGEVRLHRETAAPREIAERREHGLQRRL